MWPSVATQHIRRRRTEFQLLASPLPRRLDTLFDRVASLSDNDVEMGFQRG